MSKEELKNLSALLNTTICMAVRYTLFDLNNFRELQTLLWSMEAVLALLEEQEITSNLESQSQSVVRNKNKTVKQIQQQKTKDIERETSLYHAQEALLSLARIFSVQFNVRLGLLLSRNLVGGMEAVSFTYSSPTLKGILEPSLFGPGVISSQIQVKRYFLFIFLLFIFSLFFYFISFFTFYTLFIILSYQILLCILTLIHLLIAIYNYPSIYLGSMVLGYVLRRTKTPPAKWLRNCIEACRCPSSLLPLHSWGWNW